MTGIVEIIDDPWDRSDGPRPANIIASIKIIISQVAAWISCDHGAQEHLKTHHSGYS
jgi:hypothetical protein